MRLADAIGAAPGLELPRPAGVRRVDPARPGGVRAGGRDREGPRDGRTGARRARHPARDGAPGPGSDLVGGRERFLDEIQPGSYVLMDADYVINEEPPPFRQALFVHGRVISAASRPGGGRHRAQGGGGLDGPADAAGPPVGARAVGRAHDPAGRGGRLPRYGSTVRLIPGHCDPTGAARTGSSRCGATWSRTSGRSRPGAAATSGLRPPTIDDIRAARDRLAGVTVRTPLVRLNADGAGAEIWLKLENLQPIGSFKLRGAANAMRLAGPRALRDGVYTASAGNMAQGVAWSARAARRARTVVVPDHAPATKLGGHRAPRRPGRQGAVRPLVAGDRGAHAIPASTGSSSIPWPTAR